MIDESRLIDNLKKEWEELCDYSENVETLLEYVIRFIGSQPKIGGWIPCSERLSEVEQTVLLSLRSLDVSVGFRANTDGYFYTEGEGYVLYENVLAWQPLPEEYHG